MEKTHFLNRDNLNETSYNLGEQRSALPLFDNLIWLTTDEAAKYIRKTSNALRIAVHKGHINARKFKRRLYFKKNELDLLIDNSF
jgi:hypothetical protein